MSSKQSFFSPQEVTASLHSISSLRAPEASFRGLFSRESKATTVQTSSAVPLAYETRTQMEVDSLLRGIKKVQNGVVPDATGKDITLPLNPVARQLLVDLLQEQIDTRPTIPTDKDELPTFVATEKEWRQENQRARTKVGMVGGTMAPLSALRARTDLPAPFEMAVQGAASLAEDAIEKLLNTDGQNVSQLEKKLKAIQAVNERVAKNAESALGDVASFTEADCKAILGRLKVDFDKIAGK